MQTLSARIGCGVLPAYWIPRVARAVASGLWCGRAKGGLAKCFLCTRMGVLDSLQGPTYSPPHARQ